MSGNKRNLVEIEDDDEENGEKRPHWMPVESGDESGGDEGDEPQMPLDDGDEQDFGEDDDDDEDVVQFEEHPDEDEDEDEDAGDDGDGDEGEWQRVAGQVRESSVISQYLLG